MDILKASYLNVKFWITKNLNFYGLWSKINPVYINIRNIDQHEIVLTLTRSPMSRSVTSHQYKPCQQT